VSGLTLKRDVIYTATRGGTTLIVEFLVCGHCEAKVNVMYEMGKDHCHCHCPRCRVSYCDVDCPDTKPDIGGNDNVL